MPAPQVSPGAAGTSAALNIDKRSEHKYDMDRPLGGNTQTYHHPDTGATIDYGVQI